MLGQLTQSGLSLLLVEQNIQLSLRSVDYAYVLQRGEQVKHGLVENSWTTRKSGLPIWDIDAILNKRTFLSANILLNAR